MSATITDPKMKPRILLTDLPVSILRFVADHLAARGSTRTSLLAFSMLNTKCYYSCAFQRFELLQIMIKSVEKLHADIIELQNTLGASGALTLYAAFI